jgi:hypothetical protein
MDHSELASNFAMVRNMTRAAVQRLARDPKLLSHLNSLIQHQIQRGFIELVPNTELSRWNGEKNNCLLFVFILLTTGGAPCHGHCLALIASHCVDVPNCHCH